MIVYRIEKGSPLTVEEVDGNFKDIVTRLELLEMHLESQEGIGKILVQGDQMTILGTFGTEFGTFTLPKASLKPQGNWLSQTSYQRLDVVIHDNGVYCCEKDHLSTTWDQDVSLWQEMLMFPPFPSSLPLYEKATLPRNESLGKMAILMEEKGPTFIFFNGKEWQQLLKGDPL